MKPFKIEYETKDDCGCHRKAFVLHCPAHSDLIWGDVERNSEGISITGKFLDYSIPSDGSPSKITLEITLPITGPNFYSRKHYRCAYPAQGDIIQLLVDSQGGAIDIHRLPAEEWKKYRTTRLLPISEQK